MRRRTAGRAGSPWTRLATALATTLCACAIGFLWGRQYEHGTLEGRLLDVPGLADYQAMAYYNHYSIVRANGPSMQPTLARYNFLLVRGTRSIRRGDILISRSHGMHRALGLPGETIWLVAGRVRVCTPRTGRAPDCRLLDEPYVYYPDPRRNAGPVTVRGGYIAVPDNRACCGGLLFVPFNDVVGVEAGSLLSYGSLGPANQPQPGWPRRLVLRYER